MAIASVEDVYVRDETNINIASSTIVERDKSITAMRKYIDGDSWLVTYYMQNKTSSDSPHQLDSMTDRSEGAYTKINELDIKLSSALETVKVEELSGSGTLPFGVTPNNGDMILATVVTGEPALFTVTSVKKESYNLEDVYFIEFSIDSIGVDNFRIQELDKRVAREYVHVKSKGVNEQEGIITLNESLLLDKIGIAINVIPTIYTSMYLQQNGYTCYESCDNILLIDAHMAKFFSRIVPDPDMDMCVPDVTLGKGILRALLEKGYHVKERECSVSINSSLGGPLRTSRRLPRSINLIMTTTPIGGRFEWPRSKYFKELPYDSKLYLPLTGSIERALQDILDGKPVSRTVAWDMVNEYTSVTKEEGYWILPLMLFILIYYKSDRRTNQKI